MIGKIILICLILFSLPVYVQGQNYAQPLTFQIKPDTSWVSGDSLFIQVQVIDSLNSQVFITTDWLSCLPNSQFVFNLQIPFINKIYGWMGRIKKITVTKKEVCSDWSQMWYFRFRVITAPGCSCINPVNGSVIEVIR